MRVRALQNIRRVIVIWVTMIGIIKTCSTQYVHHKYSNDCIDCNSAICTNKVVKCNHVHTEAQQKLLTLSLNYFNYPYHSNLIPGSPNMHRR